MSAPEGTPEFAITGYGLFAPGFAGADAWFAGESSDDAQPTGEFIDRRSRRRVSDLTKALADVYAECVAAAEVDAATVPAVFGSALGEASTMIGLLDQMWRDGEGLSPMKFAMSVHNAAAGVVSISGKNKGFTTSLGADFDTPAMSISEALGLVATRGTPVVVVCGDDAVPVDIVPEDKAWSLFAAAVVVAPVTAAPDAPRVRGPFIGQPTVPPSDVPGSLARNPNVGLLDLIAAVRGGTHGVVRADRGAGLGWCFEVCA